VLREVIRHEQSRRDDFRDNRQSDQVSCLLLDRHGVDAFQPELDALRNERHRFRLLGRRVLVAPECVRRYQLAIGRKLLPEFGRTCGGVGHGDDFEVKS
jgi:hypothetical protein